MYSEPCQTSKMEFFADISDIADIADISDIADIADIFADIADIFLRSCWWHNVFEKFQKVFFSWLRYPCQIFSCNKVKPQIPWLKSCIILNQTSTLQKFTQVTHVSMAWGKIAYLQTCPAIFFSKKEWSRESNPRISLDYFRFREINDCEFTKLQLTGFIQHIK